jgi:isopentenyl-diphosphate delta-isomerase
MDNTKDQILLVDINDKIIGSSNKLDAHTKPTLHRAFSVFLYYNDSILIQKRALCKYHSAGKWANSCCSHQRVGEELMESASRRLFEELSVKCELLEISNFVYFSKFNDNMYEYEYDHVLIGEYSGHYTIDIDEASEAKWISIEDLSEDLLNNPEIYSSWFKIAAPMVIKYLNNK